MALLSLTMSSAQQAFQVGITTVAWLITAFVGWIAGCVVIWSPLFAIGNFLYASGDPSRLSQAREDARVARG